MSYYYEKIQDLISQHTNAKPLQDFYTDQAIKRLKNIKNPHRNCFLLLQDLKIHLQKHSSDIELVANVFENVKENEGKSYNKSAIGQKIKFGDGIVTNLIEKLFFYKSLHLRAIILDVIDTDYESDKQTFYKPEKWIYDVIQKIDDTFDGLEFKDDFLRYFANVIVNTFTSKNKKFGYNGNQLLINMIVFERCYKLELTDCKREIEKHFDNGRLMRYDEMKSIIEECDQRCK